MGTFSALTIYDALWDDNDYVGGSPGCEALDKKVTFEISWKR